MKNLYIALVLITSVFHLQGQDNLKKVEFGLGSELVSRYVWRGTQLSSTPSIQPQMSVDFAGFELACWGAYNFNGAEGAEVDLSLSYTIPGELLTFMLTDYYFPEDQLEEGQYFNYKNKETGHILETTISFNGTENFPLSFLISTNFFGDDSRKVNNEPGSEFFNETEGVQFSTYLELAYTINIDEFELNAFAGFTPNKPKAAKTLIFNNVEHDYVGETGFYGKTRGFVTLGVSANYALPISEQFSLPISSSLIINPMSENIFLVFGISI